MQRIVFLLSVVVLFVAACSAGSSPSTETPTPEPPTKTPLPPSPTDTSKPEPSATITPRPTIDLELVLTPKVMVAYEVHYLGLKTSDDVQIIAKQFGGGEIAVILAHQGTQGANQRDWEAFAKMIAERDFAAATLDFRGRGLSKGDYNATNLLIRDMRALIDRLREEGYDRIVCMGASMGGSTCLRAAVEYELEGLVVIGSMMSNGEPTKITADELAALTIPKLFITTEEDRFGEIPAAIKDMYEIAQEPKLLRIFPGEVHGTEMFNQPYGEEFTAELLAFLESLR
jgi:predicted alpha/beta-hydrolase family hydrolase